MDTSHSNRGMRQAARWATPADDSAGVASSVLSPTTGTGTADSPAESCGHGLECAVQHRLQSEPGLQFDRLVVRRVEGGVCLEGELRQPTASPELSALARQVAGVTRVLDRVLRSGIDHPV
jgi:osmotically-inducible protein OsmY